MAAFSLEALSTLGPKEGDPKRAAAVSPRRERDWGLGTLSLQLVRVQCWKGESRVGEKRSRNLHRRSQESVARCSVA